MNLKSNWQDFALCRKDKNPNKWFSFDIDDINYAKNVCRKCTVRNECLISAISSDNFLGVNAGMSEYEFLIETWVEAKEYDETNWPRTDRAFQRLLRKIA